MAVLHCERRHTSNMDELQSLCVSISLHFTFRRYCDRKKKKKTTTTKKRLAKLNLDEKHKTWLFRWEWRNSLHAREIISPIWDVAAINEKRCISNLQSWTTQWIKKHISHEAVGVTASLVQADYRYPWIRHWAKKTVKEASFTEMLRVWHHSL